MPTTPPQKESRPDDGVFLYDWSDPEAYRPPAAAGDSGRGHFGFHAFWERLPFPGVPWRRVMTMGIVCFGLWFLLDAPSLQHSAQVSPLGSRRTVSLDVVGPMAALSRTLGLSTVVGSADRALGRTPGGGPALAVPIRKPKPTPIPVAGVLAPTSTALPPLDSHPTPAKPFKVLIVGDSVGLDLGQPLVNTLASYGDVTTFLDGRIDTGLSRPDYFNWPAELQIDLTNQQPNLVVVMIGANDPQSLVTPDGSLHFGQPGWDAAYSARVAAFIAEANGVGAHVLWVGMPPMQDPGLDTALTHLNDLVQIQVAQVKDHGARYLSSTPSLGDKKGTYAAVLPDTTGAEVSVRTADGIHLTPGGGARLATAVAGAMLTQLHVHLVPSNSAAGPRT